MRELNYHIGQFNYLEPTVKSVQSLFHWLDRGQAPSEYYALALRYNIEASNRFRLSSLRVNEARISIPIEPPFKRSYC